MAAGNPGAMNRRLTVQVRTMTKDGAGARTETWADAFKVWAQPVKQSAREAIVSDAERTSDTRQFRIRHHSTITAGTHRILYQLRFYDITAVDEEGIRDKMMLTCTAIQSLTS